MLLRALPTIFRKRNRRTSRVAKSAPPTTTNRIQAVAHGAGGDDEMAVTVQGPLDNVSDWALAIEVFDGTEWSPALGGNWDALPLVTVLFGKDVSSATLWRVPEASVWEFTTGGALGEPLSGNID